MALRANVVTLSSVEPEEVEWLWPDRFPAGKLVSLIGDPGTGKTTMTLDLAAHVTTGKRWPDGTPCEIGDVLLMSAEDGLADTTIPRLLAAGADLDRVHALTSVPLPSKDGKTTEDVPLSLPRDIPYIAAAIRRYNTRLVIIDPFTAFLGGEVDSYKDQHVRRVMHPLSMLADETGCTFILVRHLNKGSATKAAYRAGGSIGIGAASRAEFLVGNHPKDNELRVLAPVKFNLGPKPPSMAFRLVEDPDTGMARVKWDREPIDITADELVDVVSTGSRAPHPTVQWLEELLSDGPMFATDVVEEAAEAGFSVSQVKNARKKLNLDRWRERTPNGPWIVGFARDNPQTQPRATTPKDSAANSANRVPRENPADERQAPGGKEPTKRVRAPR